MNVMPMVLVAAITAILVARQDRAWSTRKWLTVALTGFLCQTIGNLIVGLPLRQALAIGGIYVLIMLALSIERAPAFTDQTAGLSVRSDKQRWGAVFAVGVMAGLTNIVMEQFDLSVAEKMFFSAGVVYAASLLIEHWQATKG